MESRKNFLILFLGLACVHANDWSRSSYFRRIHDRSDHGWSYEGYSGPSHWAEEYPDCGGKAQSPIDIKLEKAKNVFFTRDLKLQKYGKAISGSFVNNGHSLQFNPTNSPVQLLSHGSLKGKNKYQFTQLHFHWGSNDSVGSEHTVDGFRYPLEMHLVHTNTKYADNATEALYNKDGLAVIGVFGYVIPDYINEAFDPVAFAALELSLDSPNEVEVDATIVLDDLLSEIEGSDYFSYQGSLTTPGCFEVVSWIVMNEPILIGESQVAALRTLMNENGGNLVDNFRPIQDLNDRVVRRIL